VGDLSRLKLLVEHLPDEPLMRALESAHGNARDDCPVRAMWNSLPAGVVFQHASIESLRGEHDSNWGVQRYTFNRPDGRVERETKQ
jgi:hypothetical protein